MQLLILDLLPAYISFEKQSTKADGSVSSPTGTPTVSIYEEGGADSTYDNSQITGSPFTCAIINGKLGNFGVLVDKSLFTAGKIYRILYEWVVDSISTALEENFLVINASQLKATGFSTPANITTAHATTDGKVDDVQSQVDDNYDRIDDVILSLDTYFPIVLADTGPILVDTNEIQGKLPTGDLPDVDDIWDELITPAHHNIKNSAGRSLFKIPAIIVHSGIAQGAGTGNNQIQLDTDASAVNGAYDPNLVYIIEGTGAGQSRLIIDYVGFTRVCTIDRNWRVNPDDTSEFIVVADAGREHTNEGLVVAATASTITLNGDAMSTDDYYKNHLIFIRSGIGRCQARTVKSYVGSTKIATLRRAWTTIPDTTSGYIVLPNDSIEEIINEINENDTNATTNTNNIISEIEKKREVRKVSEG